MEVIDVPSHFLCPISLQLMRDPVTISTGITYDREHIEKWIFSFNHKSCPVTRQVLPEYTDLTPNHTLRRLIQSWCTINSSYGIEQIPTPGQQLNRTQLFKLLNDAKKSPEMQLKCLKRIASISRVSTRNKQFLEENGVVEFLVSVFGEFKESYCFESIEEASNILYHLQVSDTSLKQLLQGQTMECLVQVLKCGDHQSRSNAIMLIKYISNVANQARLIDIDHELFIQVVHILQEDISKEASKAALKLLVETCTWGRNRIKAVEAGVVDKLIELLLEVSDRRACELVLIVLDLLCCCAEGRAELLRHGAGLAIVSKKILRVSQMASDRGLRIISSISKFSATTRVLQEMLQVGIVSKLCLVLQVDNNLRTNERVKEILRLHSRVWRDAPCIPLHLLSSYPSP